MVDFSLKSCGQRGEAAGTFALDFQCRHTRGLGRISDIRRIKSSEIDSNEIVCDLKSDYQIKQKTKNKHQTNIKQISNKKFQ